MMYVFLCKVTDCVIHFCLQSSLRVILPPNFSLDNITYYYVGYLEEWVEFLYLEPICLHNVKLLIYVIFVLCFHCVSAVTFYTGTCYAYWFG